MYDVKLTGRYCGYSHTGESDNATQWVNDKILDVNINGKHYYFEVSDELSMEMENSMFRTGLVYTFLGHLISEDIFTAICIDAIVEGRCD